MRVRPSRMSPAPFRAITLFRQDALCESELIRKNFATAVGAVYFAQLAGKPPIRLVAQCCNQITFDAIIACEGTNTRGELLMPKRAAEQLPDPVRGN